METSERIDQAVESLRTEALELIQTLVRIPTLPGFEKGAQDVVAARMEAMGLAMDIWDPVDPELQAHPAYVPSDFPYTGRPNVVGLWKGRGGGKSLIFNGHVDVVPTGEEGKWTHSPWSGDFSEGRIYGRGSADMKAGCVVNLMVVKALQKAGLRLKGNVVLESVVDEENGGNGTLACVLRGYTGDGMVFSEPSADFALGIAQRGAQFFRLKIAGEEGSIEGRVDLVNPIGKALQVYQAVLESQASEHAARMVAMRNATDNAIELVDHLQLVYNKARQQSITNDLLDIAGGAEALAQALAQG